MIQINYKIISKLYFKEHIGYIINKAKQMLGFVKRYSKELNLLATKTFYTSWISSHLEMLALYGTMCLI